MDQHPRLPFERGQTTNRQPCQEQREQAKKVARRCSSAYVAAARRGEIF